MNNGAGDFSPTGNHPVTPGPKDISTRDLDGDGAPDLIVIGSTPPVLEVRLGNGQGGFQTAVTLALNGPGVGVEVDDLNGDGLLDIVAGTDGPGAELEIFLNVGQGQFGAGLNMPSVGVANHLLLADFTADGLPDAAYVDGTSAYVAVGDGLGAFAAPLATDWSPPFGSTKDMAAGDMNEDGHLDLIIGRSAAPQVLLLLGDGSGHFTPPVAPPNLVVTVDHLAIADLDGNGHLDLFVDDDGSGIGGTIFFGNGQGAFGPAKPIVAGTHCLGATIADLNGDGRLEVVTTSARGLVTVSYDDGFGDIGGVPFDDGNPLSFLLHDADADGDEDYVLGPNFGAGGLVRVVDNDGFGNLTPGSEVAVSPSDGFVGTMVKGDVDNDGITDVVAAVVSIQQPNALNVFRGDGQGGFSLATVVSVGEDAVTALALRDLNGDANIDLVAVVNIADSIVVYQGDGLGQFTLVGSLPTVDGTTGSIVVEDVNGDGLLDLIATTEVMPGTGAGAHLEMFLSTAPLMFQSPLRVPCGPGARGLAASDLDGDGNVDFAVGNGATIAPGQWTDEVSLLFGDGQGGFSIPVIRESGSFPATIAATDIDGDGDTDLVVGDQFDANVALLLGDGSGGFDTARRFAAGVGSTLMEVGDYNGDGSPDLTTNGLTRLPQTDPLGPCAGTSTTFGHGCPGDGGFTPYLQGFGCPSPGRLVELSITGAHGGDAGVLLVGTGQSAVPIGSGCTLNVATVLPAALPIVVGGVGSGAGSIAIPAVVSPSIQPITVTLQAFLFDLSTASGLSNTNGLELDIQ